VNPYIVGGRGLCKKRVVKTARKEQGKAVMYARFVMSRFKSCALL